MPPFASDYGMAPADYGHEAWLDEAVVPRAPRPPGMPDWIVPATRRGLIQWGYPEEAIGPMLDGSAGHDFYLSVDRDLEVTVSHDEDPLDRAEHDEPRFSVSLGRSCEAVERQADSERWEDVLAVIMERRN